jgi:hypothetical protein
MGSSDLEAAYGATMPDGFFPAQLDAIIFTV